MTSYLRPAVSLMALFTLLLGLGYPLAMTSVAQGLFPSAANGSLIRNAKGETVASSLIGRTFEGDGYFQPRPSAAGAGYDASASAGSNLGPTDKRLIERVSADVAAYQAANGPGPVPADAVTTSASGLDPHISPANAERQLARVATARGLSETRLRDLVSLHTERPWLGFVGTPGVNTVTLNLALDGIVAR
ncbi:potassium-transporting ATPase subunit KdpC [Lacibacterium aquatile]|uniref:Potassium-transporting ATPase KdpC subunit n=1 Tax=Lacibacterium aquatile TaxID=1168082 RepID=A0ABW5DQU1_9PROT